MAGKYLARVAFLFPLLLFTFSYAAFHAGALQPRPAPRSFRFCILGDRTGEAVSGVYQEAWREANLDHPDFVITVGDTIQGGNDLTLDSEWREVQHLLNPYRRYPLFLIPGNHDIWSPASARAYEQFSRHPLHYSFDFQQAHFTVLDNSRTDDLPAGEIAFLRQDLELHRETPLKFVFMHRPSWILQVVLQNPDFPLNRLVKQYGVKFVIAGHIHQMLRFDLQGITYVSLASSGGHLRQQKDYQHGWFFEHTLVEVDGGAVRVRIKELTAPFGEGRETALSDWGSAGLEAQ